MIQTILSKVLKKVAPPPPLTVSQWADKYRMLSPESSAEAGKWDTQRTPYLKEPMDEVNNPKTYKITLMFCSQVGKSELLNNVIGYHADYDPCPILLVQPTLQMAEAYSKDRIAPMFRDSPSLRDKVNNKKTRDGDNTILHKKFPGGHLTLAGANSPASLASRPIRILLNDEKDRYPASAGGEGDPAKLAAKRTATFYNSKIIEVSTPTVQGRSVIEKDFDNSDKRRFHVHCPFCKHSQHLKWQSIKWDKEEPETALYFCESCGEGISEKHKSKMLKGGYWKAENKFKGVAGFHLNELYSPWRKWCEVVRDFLDAKKLGPEALKAWVNTSLGETWKETDGDVPEWELIYMRRSKYKIDTVPLGGVILTAGADVQKDRIEIEVVAWGRDLQSWSVTYRVFPGDTSSEVPWRLLDDFLNETFLHESGAEMHIQLLNIDTGYNTQDVYDWVRKKASSRIRAIKGNENQFIAVGIPKAADINKKGKRIARGLKLWPIGVNILKSEIYGWLRIRPPIDSIIKEKGYPRGFCHFPEYDEDFFKMLTAEEVVAKIVKGQKKYVWVKHRERNEALDCRVYARAAAIMLGLDRWKEDEWTKRESDLGRLPTKSKPKGKDPANGVKKDRKTISFLN